MLKNKNIAPAGSAHNVITAGTIIKGDIKAEEDFRIDGRVEGTIDCAGKVIVGPDAEVIGNIYCNNADLMGKIRGNIEVQETVSLKHQVNLTGEIITKFLDIESGAIFNGVCKMQQ
ncbi:MAG: polymer-forming cytoskeletal protein [Dysgonamonadaceae bacterium]|jgi:cytoskeletal protein CcmA (bactofilin family)|nr:polymer-forming cytoskeletal protein [Dysgonamonadaceae bacterium]